MRRKKILELRAEYKAKHGVLPSIIEIDRLTAIDLFNEMGQTFISGSIKDCTYSGDIILFGMRVKVIDFAPGVLIKPRA